jgi:hypothetical protein
VDKRRLELIDLKRCPACNLAWRDYGGQPGGVFVTLHWTDDVVTVFPVCAPCCYRLGESGSEVRLRQTVNEWLAMDAEPATYRSEHADVQ